MTSFILLGIAAACCVIVYRGLKSLRPGLWYVEYTIYQEAMYSYAHFTYGAAEKYMMEYHPEGRVVSRSEKERLLRENYVKTKEQQLGIK